MTLPTYSAALSRLQTFVPKAGRDYASKRNFDNLANVSLLSPYIRHRIISEETVLEATLARHSASAAQKFIQEVFWRTYWKGWLELRPQVWAAYRAELGVALNRVQTESGLRREWEAACNGDTGIACFDHWAKQLRETGYLHNHARMWFASIWIFTLKLPWTLGADLFLRQLMDGDPASNTLSWRWVGGLQTIGKTYLARADNIAKYTDGRFRPVGLATTAKPLTGTPHPPRRTPPTSHHFSPGGRIGLLLTEEDLSPGWLCDLVKPVASASLQTTQHRSPLAVSDKVEGFVKGAFDDTKTRLTAKLPDMTEITADQLDDWRNTKGLDTIVTSYLPVGPTRDALAKHGLCQVIRPFDAAAWPHATHGFFRFKEKIPALISRLGHLEAV